jgi:hypothetical protein
MNAQQINFNPHLSVDCVIFGFDGIKLKVLLVKQKEFLSGEVIRRKYKLPGDLIHLREDLDEAAERVLLELTGLKDIFLHQFSVFGEPQRIMDTDDKAWLERTSGVKIERVVTTAYFSLIKIAKSNPKKELNNDAIWHDIKKLPPLTFDHKTIILKGLESLRKEIRFEPICFELLPGKFTIRQIQTLYEVILDQKLDNRNFRKKLLKACYIEALNIKQRDVAHKPAMYYAFNSKKYLESRKDVLYYNF